MDINAIGTIIKSIPTDDPEVFETETLEGFHVNTTAQVGGWSEFQVFPKTPYNAYYGVETFYYTFESEQHYKDVAGIVDELEGEFGGEEI